VTPVRDTPARGAALSALVLAGGAGRRLGGRKDGVLVGRATLLQRSLAVAVAVSDDVILLPGSHVLPAPSLVRVVADEPGAPGPLGALLAGLRAARHDACLLLPCDMPFARPDVAGRLARRATGSALAAVVAGPQGREPFHAIWRRDAADVVSDVVARGGRSLREVLDELAARGALAEVPAAVMQDLDPELAFLVNVNAADDLSAARRKAERAEAGA
jgi:molybdopterin-guanine dinucleotide biosynthesis protein A